MEAPEPWLATFQFDDRVAGWESRIVTPVDPALHDGAALVADLTVVFQPPGMTDDCFHGWARSWIAADGSWLRHQVIFAGESEEIHPTTDRFFRQGGLLLKQAGTAAQARRIPPRTLPTWLHWLDLYRLPELEAGGRYPLWELDEGSLELREAVWAVEPATEPPHAGAPMDLLRVALTFPDGREGNVFWLDAQRHIWQASWQGPHSERVADPEALLERLPAALATRWRETEDALAALEQVATADAAAAGAALAELPLRPALLPRIRALLRDHDPARRQAALQVAGHWQDPALPQLLRADGAWDPARPLEAAPLLRTALARCGDPIALGAVRALLDAEDAFLQGEALVALSMHGWVEIAGELIQRLPPPENLVFGEYALALGRLRHQEATGALRTALHGPHAERVAHVQAGATANRSLSWPLWRVLDEALLQLGGDDRDRAGASNLTAARARWPLPQETGEPADN